MPHIQLYDYFGSVSTLDSGSPEIIQAWLLENMQRLCTSNSALGPVRVQVMPIWSPDSITGELVPDWPGGDMRDYTLLAEQLRPLADFLDDSRETKPEELPFP